jgi:hypothetical protein
MNIHLIGHEYPSLNCEAQKKGRENGVPLHEE